MKTFLIVGIFVVLVAVGAYFVINNPQNNTVITDEGQINVVVDKNETNVETEQPAQTEEEIVDKTKTEIGMSSENRPIVAYHYGTGEDELLFIGGIHGGYSWNTSLVAYQLMEHLKKNPSLIPENIKVTVIPVFNPDGLSEVIDPSKPFTASDITNPKTQVVAARFNANDVDLNRNFDCNWESEGVWRNTKVSGGDEAFSEPESQALREYVDKSDSLVGVVAWYSAAGGVYASQCDNGVLPETGKIMKVFGDASKYPTRDAFDYYALTGDMMNWFAKIKIPAISILLTDHENTEWSKNRAGIEALLTYYAN